MTGLFHRHLRFLLAFALGTGVWLGSRALPVPEVYGLLASINAFFVL
ncbi:MAG: hypothetical protein MUE83_08890 [Tabrizicola sp.]|nr:hypothetical protein [Tabrizicola sp.]